MTAPKTPVVFIHGLWLYGSSWGPWIELPSPLSALRSTLPVFKNPAKKHKAVTLSAEQFRYGFGNAAREDESQIFKQYKHSSPATDIIEFEDRGHSLTIDRGWGDVADAGLNWLDKQGLRP